MPEAVNFTRSHCDNTRSLLVCGVDHYATNIPRSGFVEISPFKRVGASRIERPDDLLFRDAN